MFVVSVGFCVALACGSWSLRASRAAESILALAMAVGFSLSVGCAHRFSVTYACLPTAKWLLFYVPLQLIAALLQRLAILSASPLTCTISAA